MSFINLTVTGDSLERWELLERRRVILGPYFGQVNAAGCVCSPILVASVPARLLQLKLGCGELLLCVKRIVCTLGLDLLKALIGDVFAANTMRMDMSRV